MSFLILPYYLVILLALAYAGFLWRVAITWRKASQTIPAEAEITTFPFLSILVPARNEAANISDCLQAILAQDYPADAMEVIVVDDHSTDATAAIVTAFNDPRIRLLSLAPAGSQRGKKAALQLAIEHSRGDYLLTTDADCLAPPTWLHSFAVSWQAGADMVLAPVRMEGKHGLLSAFQGLDVAGTLLLTGASVHWQRPLLANGANLGFRKALFYDLNGYQGNESRASGDDVLLLQKAVQQPRTKINFLYVTSALIDTASVDSWQQLFWQRLRWAGKTDAYQDSFLLLFQAAVYGLCALLFVLLFPTLFWGVGTYGLLAAWLIKVFSDGLFLRYACQQIGYQAWLRWFLPAQLLHTLYVFVIGSLALLPLSYYWKGRKLR